MTKKTKTILAEVQETIDGVVSDKSVGREELRDFLDEVEGFVDSIRAGLDDDEKAGR